MLVKRCDTEDFLIAEGFIAASDCFAQENHAKLGRVLE